MTVAAHFQDDGPSSLFRSCGSEPFSPKLSANTGDMGSIPGTGRIAYEIHSVIAYEISSVLNCQLHFYDLT